MNERKGNKIKMRKSKTQKGITLIALIITIVVLLILAAVAISSITNDGILSYAQNATKGYEEAQEKENIQLAINEWTLVKYSDAGKIFAEFLGEKFGAGNVVDNGDNTYNVTVESGNIYKVQENGTITPAKGISIVGAGNPLMLEEGKTVTETLTATLVGISGEITWSNENNSVATISATSGASVTVTAVAKGETKVTASCSGYSAEYTVKVKEPATVKVGSYVEYDVSYTDMYSGITYDNSEEGKYGWRYLGTDGENKLLVSTAIPVVLYYSSSSNDSSAKWWDTDTTLNANVRATNGMLSNFEKIPFAQKSPRTSMSSGEENTAIGAFAPSTETYNGTNYNAVGDYFKSNTYESKILDVRILTLAELNRAMNSATGGSRAETNASSGFKDLKDEALGLFDMQDLTGYKADYFCWLASHGKSDAGGVYQVYFSNSNAVCSGGGVCGVRPVVVLSSDVEIVDTNEDGVFEIQ